MMQKTKVLTLVVFGLLFLNLSAQNDEFSNDEVAKLADADRKVRFGLQFSPNISWLKASTAGYNNEGSKIGFSYGLSIEYFMTKNYLFSTGINLLKAGGKLSYKTAVNTSDVASFVYYNPIDVEEDYTIKYIEIPLSLKLRTNEIGYLTYFGQFGFNLGFNYKSSAEYDYTIGSNTLNAFIPTSSNDISKEINWINLSLVVGAGVEYNISGNTSVAVGLTFNNGFINQLDSEVHELNASGNALIDSDGKPVLSSKNASANLNYVTLNIAVYF